jgi:hypothetical protein
MNGKKTKRYYDGKLLDVTTTFEIKGFLSLLNRCESDLVVVEQDERKLTVDMSHLVAHEYGRQILHRFMLKFREENPE